MIGMYVTSPSGYTMENVSHPCSAGSSGLENYAAISASSLMGIFEFPADGKTTGVPINPARSVPSESAYIFFRRLPGFEKPAKYCHTE